MSRRRFLGESVGFGAVFAVPGVASAALAGGGERLRFGVLSDIHVSTEAQQPAFERALRWFESRKVDAVLACGDLANYGMEAQLQLVADIWFKVFPDGRGGDGREVVNLMHYGDHDMQDDRYVDRPDAAARWPDAAFRHGNILFAGDRKAAWERCFREPWAPLVYKEVKGYPFVLSHFTRGETTNKWGNNVPGLADFLKAHPTDPSKPLFYSQHRIPRGTVGGPDVYGQDDGQTTRLFSSYPNLLAFCGHAHLNGGCERSVWQGAFTCVQVPSLRYTVTLGGYENGRGESDKKASPPRTMPAVPTGQTEQGFLCRVYDEAIVIERHEFRFGERLGPDWVIPTASFRLPANERPFSVVRRETAVVSPSFPIGALVSVGAPERRKDRSGAACLMVPVTFPAIVAADGLPRPDAYEVVLETKDGDHVVAGLSRRVFSPTAMRGEASDKGPVTCCFRAEDLPPTGDCRFSVRPLTAFGVRGKPIVSQWKSALSTTNKGVK